MRGSGAVCNSFSVLELQDDNGLAFWHYHDVATLTPEICGRWRAVMKDGSIAHRPAPPVGPWVPLGGSLVLPQLLTRTSDGWTDPAGFTYPTGDLPLVPDPLPTPTAPGLPCDPDRIISLEAMKNRCTWHTDDGPVIIERITAKKASGAHPSLLRVGLNYINLRRLRRLDRTEVYQAGFVMDDGAQFLVSGAQLNDAVKRLGLADVDYLESTFQPLFRYGLRDYPYEIASAPAARLRRDFPTAKLVLANQIYQAVRYRAMGIPVAYGHTQRGFWYMPMVTTLYRAGFLTEEEMRVILSRRSDGASPRHKLFNQMERMLGDMVGTDRLFTYSQLGFGGNAKEIQVGSTRPQIVVLCEKDSLKKPLALIAEKFGVSTMCSGGTPALVQTENFLEALRAVYGGELVVLAFVDFDPDGWGVAEAFCNQLQRYGAQIRGALRYVVTAEAFTAEELELFSLPCPSGNPASAAKTKKWLANGGGIHGKAMCIHADHLVPPQRVVEIVGRLIEEIEQDGA